MFAGPNGSGKSVLIEDLKDRGLPLGPVVNADELLGQLKKAQYVDLSSYYLKNISQEQWDTGIKTIDELASRIKKSGRVPKVEIVENILVCKDGYLNAYSAALIADFIRHMMVEQRVSFSFETVMSHSSKIEFLDIARQEGYKAYLYYIATSDSEINVDRVKKRVQDGGHDVPEQKIKSRYERSLNLLVDAYEIADKAYIMDSSKKESTVVYEKTSEGRGQTHVDDPPNWLKKSLLDKLG